MKKILLASALLLGVSFTSCNSYLDINTDPNSPAEENVETSMLMPAIEMNTASSYGNFLRIAGGFHAQQYAALIRNKQLFGLFKVQHVGYSLYRNLYIKSIKKHYRILKTLLIKSAEQEDWGTYLAGTVLRAFVYEALVDCYGEVPYTEALDLENFPDS